MDNATTGRAGSNDTRPGQQASGLVSVITTAHNAESFVADSIRSILAQTYENWELLIVDDCSSDKTPRIIDEFTGSDPRIKVIHNNQNLGPYPSANIALRHAVGEFIARLDADDVSEPSRLQKQVHYLETHPNTALVGSGGFQIDGSGRQVRKIHAVSRDCLVRRLMIHANLFIHSSIMVRREALEDIGGYREKFRYVADYDLCLRLSDRYTLSNLPEHLVGWRTPESSITMKNHILQRAYADITREFALERMQEGWDSYTTTDFDEKVNAMMEANYGRYLCEYGVYKAFFCRRYREGMVDLLKGCKAGGIPYNALVRGIVEVVARI